VNVAQEKGLLNAEDRKRLSEIVRVLFDTFKTSLDTGNMLVHLAAARLLAILADLANVAGQDVFWDLLDHASREFEGAPDPMALLALTRTAWAAGDLARARALLAELPDAVAARYSQEADPALKLDSLRTLRRHFDHIGGLAVRGGSLDDVRLLAEAQRDMLGRVTMRRAGGGSRGTAAHDP